MKPLKEEKKRLENEVDVMQRKRDALKEQVTECIEAFNNVKLYLYSSAYSRAEKVVDFLLAKYL